MKIVMLALMLSLSIAFASQELAIHSQDEERTWIIHDNGFPDGAGSGAVNSIDR